MSRLFVPKRERLCDELIDAGFGMEKRFAFEVMLQVFICHGFGIYASVIFKYFWT